MKWLFIKLKLDAFLVTQDGSLKYYDLSSDISKVLRTNMPSDPNTIDPRQNNINPTENPSPSSEGYRPKPKIFPNLDPTYNNRSKPDLDGGLKSIEDRKREQPRIDRLGPPKIH